MARKETSADFLHAWMDKSEITDGEREIEDKFVTDADLLSYMLHPKLKGSSLRKTQKEKVFNHILKVLSSQKAVAEYRCFMDFKEGKGKFSNPSLEVLEPEIFWQHAQNFCENLSELGTKYATLPSSTVTVSNSNVKYSFLHNSHRHNLTDGELEKALFVLNSLSL